MKPSVQVIKGDCIEVMAKMDADSVDAIVTDPPYNLGFMGKKWDTYQTPLNFQLWCQSWASQCFRVLKPGGHLVSFGGTRTFHRMISAFEDAGFEIRDCISWIQAQGMPKSHNIAKAITKSGGNGQEFEGWGTGLRPSFEPIVLARKPVEQTVTANAEKYGTGGIHVDACRTLAGRWPSNVIISHTSNCVQVGQKTVISKGVKKSASKMVAAKNRNTDWMGNKSVKRVSGFAQDDGTEMIDDFICDPHCPVAFLDASSGQRKSGSKVKGTEPSRIGSTGIYGHYERIRYEPYEDSGGASRFFTTLPPFIYHPKATPKERPVVDGVRHPTVKPLGLMRHLVRLVTPAAGVILDPFAGSGTTGEAALLEGFNCVLVEADSDYVPLIKTRLRAYDSHATSKTKQATP